MACYYLQVEFSILCDANSMSVVVIFQNIVCYFTFEQLRLKLLLGAEGNDVLPLTSLNLFKFIK